LRFLLVDFVVLVDLVEALREFEDEDGFRAKGATPVGGEQYRKSADASASLQDLRDMPDSPRNHGKSVERFCACVTTMRAGPIRNIPLDACRTCVAGASRVAAKVRFKLHRNEQRVLLCSAVFVAQNATSVASRHRKQRIIAAA
jgi:hypothetical protein